MCIQAAMTTRKARENEINDKDRQAVDNFFQKQTSATRQDQAPQDETIDFLVTVTRKRGCAKDNHCDYLHPPFCVIFRRGQFRAGAKSPFVHLSKDERSVRNEHQKETK